MLNQGDCHYHYIGKNIFLRLRNKSLATTQTILSVCRLSAVGYLTLNSGKKKL